LPKKCRAGRDIEPVDSRKPDPHNPYGLEPGWGRLARDPHKKKKDLNLFMLVTFLLNFCMNVPNSCE